MSVQFILSSLSGVAFIVYGFLCLTTDHMRSEFKRYRLERFRILTGILEILGGMGSLFPVNYSVIYTLAITGLFTLMLSGVIVRLTIKDPLPKILPAFVLMAINLYLAYKHFN